MKFNIISEPSYSLAEIKLNDGESIVVEPGAMAWMDTTIKPKTEMKGGFFAGIKRKWYTIFYSHKFPKRSILWQGNK